MKRVNRIIAISLCICCCIQLLTGCSEKSNSKNQNKLAKVSPTTMNLPTQTPTLAPVIKPTTIPDQPDDAGIVIDREKHEEKQVNHVKDSWTILIYRFYCIYSR